MTTGSLYKIMDFVYQQDLLPDGYEHLLCA